MAGSSSSEAKITENYRNQTTSLLLSHWYPEPRFPFYFSRCYSYKYRLPKDPHQNCEIFVIPRHGAQLSTPRNPSSVYWHPPV